jgi:hypothetical protein
VYRYTAVAISTIRWILWLVRLYQVLGKVSCVQTSNVYNVAVSVQTSNVEVFDSAGSSCVNVVKIKIKTGLKKK